MRKYMAARLMTRPGNYLLKAKCLFQMYVVDDKYRIESERLNQLSFHPNVLRSEDMLMCPVRLPR